MIRLCRDTAGPCLAPGGSVVCVGAFDGVHLGHRALLARVRARAVERGLVPIAISFEPIPREFFARGGPVPRLTSAREKIALIGASGVEALLMLRFDAALAAMQPETFVERVLVERCAAREVWVGADFRFGRARRGDVALLEALGARLGFTVKVMEDFEVAGERISSSAVRRHLTVGEFEPAARLLGRPFSIAGHVVPGARLGRKLGWPTANLRLGRRLAPVSGIFAVRVHGLEEGAAWPGVASLGVRPTVDGSEPLLEVHLFDFAGDLYGRRIEVEFVARLREEVKFADLDAMVEQIERDADEARAMLGGVRLSQGTGSRPSPGRRS